MAGRFKWQPAVLFSLSAVLGALCARRAVFSLANLFVVKRICKVMETTMLEASQSNGISTFHKCSLFNLFEVLFNRKSEHCHKLRIKNPDAVKKKLTRMIALGKDNLQVISDFDWTLSKFVHKGEPNPTCHGIFEQDPDMTPETQNKLRILRQTYHPVEVDPTIPVSMKIPIMLEWWDLSHKVISTSSIHKDTLQATVNQCNLALRDYVVEFMTQLHKQNIPILIFSAGLGNVIELLLERFNLCFDNVRVVSNFMDFNDEGLMIGFQEPIIHTFNKTIATVSNSDYIKKVLSKRSSIILLGDSSADPYMADGIHGENADPHVNILKIGYLNDNVETLLDAYMDIYDIVLIDDATFEIPLEVLNCIVHSESLEV